MKISSIGKHHPRLREVRQALRAGSLTSDGWLPIEGPHLVDEAIRAGLEVSEAFVREDVRPRDEFSRVFLVGAGVFRDLAPTRQPQGVIALVRLPKHTLADVVAGAGRLVMLCGLQDPGNVGTIVRLAEAFGCSGCIGVRSTVGFYNAKVVRASAGSLFRMPHVRVQDLESIRDVLARASISIVGTAPESVYSIEDQPWSQPTAILFGNEGGGLSASERRVCETLLRIPCPGPVESLNTAAAAAIVLYTAARRS